MNIKLVVFVVVALLFTRCNLNSNIKSTSSTSEPKFNLKKDLLLAHYDFKTDVDDLHSVAALSTLLSTPKYSKINYHAVAGTYGIQEGLYVPPNDLMRLSFEDNWTDAHEDFDSATNKVKNMIISYLKNQGQIWIAEGGQSDFTAAVIKAVLLDVPEINTSNAIHVIQHSDWNEKQTLPKNLQFVKQNADYIKIPDGNSVGNGTPGFNSPSSSRWKEEDLDSKLTQIWQLAVNKGHKYNGIDGRYLNKTISVGGIDFSDFSEICWIIERQYIMDTEHFFDLYASDDL